MNAESFVTETVVYSHYLAVNLKWNMIVTDVQMDT